MKTNEAPEKIYLHIRANDEIGYAWHGVKITNKDIEYTRTDAFIEKACEFIAENIKCDGYTLWTKVKFIRDFKKYMEE